MKRCISCNMPLVKKEDYPLGDESKEYCVHCSYEDGTMHNYEDAVKVGTEYFIITNNWSYEKAKVECVRYLSTMPAYKSLYRVGYNGIETRCGLFCTGCSFKESHNCEGCIETGGNPFHGKCPVAACSLERGHQHCGECLGFPCELLNKYSCDPKHGDKPVGTRIRICKEWVKIFPNK